MAQRTYLTVGDVNISSSGDNTVITAVTSAPIKIYKMFLVAGGAVNLIFKHASTAFNGSAIPLIANGSSIFFQYDGTPYFYCNPGDTFVINLSAAVQVSGQIYYTIGA